MALDKQSADRLRSADQVLEAITTHTGALEAALRVQLTAPELPLHAVLSAIATSISTSADALRATSAAHQAELNDDHAPRAARDTHAATLYSAVVDLRQAVRGMYGQSTLKALGQTGTLHARPDQLLATARALLESVPTILPHHTPRFSALDPETLVAPLRAPIAGLAEALAGVDREAREAEATLIARNDAMQAYDQAFSRGAAAVASLFRLAGMDEHARRVRPSTRRPGQVAEFVDAEGALPDAEPDAAPPVTDG